MSVKYTSHTKEVLSAEEEAIARALHICGDVAVGHAYDYSPKQTGTLARSIKHKPVSKNTESVGTAIEYAPYVELGHHQEPGRYVPALKKRLKASWVAPKPYLRPAIENHRSEYETIIETELALK